MTARPTAPPSRSALAAALAAADPADADAVFKAAIGAAKNRLEAEGLALLERARPRHPADARLWQMTGLLHRQLEELEPAIAALGEAVRLAPGDALIAHAHARAHLEAGLPAVELFRKAQLLAPKDGELLLGLAAAIEEEAGPQSAIEELDHILAANPGWTPGLETVGRLRWQCGDRDGFAAGFDRAIATAPLDIGLWRSLIVSLVKGDLYEQVLDAVQRGRRAAGDHLIFDANEAVARAELRQFDAAEKLFERLESVPDATLKVRHVRHLLRTGRAAEAGELAERMAKTEQGQFFWPYLSVAWRLTGDSRWAWLEGDESLVGVYDLALPSLEALAERLRTLHRTTHQPLEQSVRGGTQTQGALFARIEPEIRTLRSAVVEAVEAHVAQLPPPRPDHPQLGVDRGGPVRFSGSWSVRLAGGGHHSNHIHPAGWFSSALYVALPEVERRGPEPAGWLTLGEPQAELGVDLPPIRRIEPRPGRLVLFPSTLWHGTVPFEAGERLTVAFDVARP